MKLDALQAEVDLVALEKQELLGKIQEQALEIERFDDVAEVSVGASGLQDSKRQRHPTCEAC